jgi:hypothetical protein
MRAPGFERGDGGLERAEQSLGGKRKLECRRELDETIGTHGIEGIALEAIDSELAAYANQAVMGPE